MSIEDEVRRVLAGIDALMPRPSAIQNRIYDLLTITYGPEWRGCRLLAHRVPGQPTYYTASAVCSGCGTIHTVLIYQDGDAFEVADSEPVHDDRGDGDGVC